MSNPIIKVNNLSKRYRIGAAEKGYKTFREVILDGISAPVRNFGKLRGLTRFKNDDEQDVIWALKDVSFEVNEGEVLGVIGKNGAGKTTLSSIIASLHPPTSGDVLWKKKSIYRDIGAYRRIIGYCPQQPNIDKSLSLEDNLYFSGLCFGLSKRTNAGCTLFPSKRFFVYEFIRSAIVYFSCCL